MFSEPLKEIKSKSYLRFYSLNRRTLEICKSTMQAMLYCILSINCLISYLKQKQWVIQFYFRKIPLHRIYYTCPNGSLTENVFKHICANSNPNLNPNPKAQKPFRKNEGNDVLFRTSVQISPTLTKLFWWFRFFLIRCGCWDIKNVPNETTKRFSVGNT